MTTRKRRPTERRPIWPIPWLKRHYIRSKRGIRNPATWNLWGAIAKRLSDISSAGIGVAIILSIVPPADVIALIAGVGHPANVPWTITLYMLRIFLSFVVAILYFRAFEQTKFKTDWFILGMCVSLTGAVAFFSFSSLIPLLMVNAEVAKHIDSYVATGYLQYLSLTIFFLPLAILPWLYRHFEARLPDDIAELRVTYHGMAFFCLGCFIEFVELVTLPSFAPLAIGAAIYK